MSATIIAPWGYRRAAKFFSEELGLQNCTITIRRVPQKELGCSKTLAICRRLKYNEYLLLISKKAWWYSDDRVRSIIAHEFVHIDQYQSGRLADYLENGHWIVYWQGKRWGPDICPSMNMRIYLNQPWEREAFELQEVLYERWLKR